MQVIIILAVFIALALREGMATVSPARLPGWFSLLTGARAPLFVAGTLLVFWAMLRILVRFMMARLNRSEDLEWRMLRLPVRLELASRGLILILFGMQLTLGGWCRLIDHELRLNRIVLLDEAALLLPFLLMVVIKLVCFYPVNRFVKEYVVAGQIGLGLSARPVWSMGEYLLFQIRHSILIVLAPLSILLLLRDLADLAAGGMLARGYSASAAQMLGHGLAIAGGGLVFLFAPFLLRLIWSTRTFPYGPLRDQLEGFLGRIGFKCRDLLLWDTYSSLANAGVMGIIPPVRFVLLSDAIVENMPDAQIEAVCGHEAGHVHHHHIPLLVMFVIGSGTVGVELVDRFLIWLDGSLDQVPLGDFGLFGGFVLIVLAALGVWLLLFGAVSRWFERQADVFSARSLRPDDPEAGPVLNPVGAMIMSMALQRVALLNGIAINARSWRHASIAARMAYLQNLSMQPGRLLQYDRDMLLLRVVIIILFLLAVGWNGYQLLRDTGTV